MEKTDTRQYETTKEVNRFCQANRPDFEAAPTGPSLLTDLGGHVADMDRVFADDQSGLGMVLEAEKVRGDRTATLTGSIDAIVAAARVAALTSTGIDARFRKGPRSSARARIAWARAFLKDVPPYLDALAAAGLSKQVVTDLPAQIDAVDKVLADKKAGLAKRADARTELESLGHARTVTLRDLDTIARSVFRTNPDKLAAWKRARRVGPKEKPAQPAASTATQVKAS